MYQMVVWIPMLDDDERGAAEAASAMFRDVVLPQFWDGTQLLGKEVARSVGVPEWTAWDVYLFYGPDAEWTDAGIPTPTAALGQASNGGRGGVIAASGTLPARGDQAGLPERFEGRAVMAGTYAELPELLSVVARRFVKEP
jgi:hypothetical protein